MPVAAAAAAVVCLCLCLCVRLLVSVLTAAKTTISPPLAQNVRTHTPMHTCELMHMCACLWVCVSQVYGEVRQGVCRAPLFRCRSRRHCCCCRRRKV